MSRIDLAPDPWCFCLLENVNHIQGALGSLEERRGRGCEAYAGPGSFPGDGGRRMGWGPRHSRTRCSRGHVSASGGLAQGNSSNETRVVWLEPRVGRCEGDKGHLSIWQASLSSQEQGVCLGAESGNMEAERPGRKGAMM